MRPFLFGRVTCEMMEAAWRAPVGDATRPGSMKPFGRAIDANLLTGGVKLPSALAELGRIDEYEIVVHPRLAGHGPALSAGLSRHVDLRLVGRQELGSGAVGLRYAPGG